MPQVVLVVDDEPKIRQLARAYLERDGYTVLEAPSGARAVELAGTVDLIVLDLGLPDRAGQDVARQVRQTSSVPIIMLTVHRQVYVLAASSAAVAACSLI